ncbi:MAG: DUF1778 domain-containing protein [Burkholderiales bacterium]|jgi:uncharacterized protein (DUF1778 family)|nr:DUF1778 domain-containing protein [Burkholderiales bacterium]
MAELLTRPRTARRREERLELRVSKSSKQLLARAAAVRQQTISAFVLENGIAAAAETLAARQAFALSAKDYDAFVAALDAPTKPKPRLDALLGTPSALE